MISHKYIRFEDSLTPWAQQDSQTLRSKPFTIENNIRIPERHASQCILKSTAKSATNQMPKRIIKRRQALRKIEQRIMAKTSTIDFNFDYADNKIKISPNHNKSPSISPNNSQTKYIKRRRQKSEGRIIPIIATDKKRVNKIVNSKSVSQVLSGHSIKNNELIINTNKSFFQSLHSRSKQRIYSNRVGDLLAIIRKTMQKDGTFSKLIKKNERKHLIKGEYFQKDKLLSLFH